MSEQVLIHLAQMTFGAFPFFVLVIAFPSGDIVTFITEGGQPVCQQSGRNSYWCLWDIRIGVFEVIGGISSNSSPPTFLFFRTSPSFFRRLVVLPERHKWCLRHSGWDFLVLECRVPVRSRIPFILDSVCVLIASLFCFCHFS